ncbi:MAG: hypothetical protein M1834_002106 [Cirrosporium novae-zelandiae]|nr:MAG: hypothetical protein M1834_002106 [Cirrosporium novae-zelandiae]
MPAFFYTLSSFLLLLCLVTRVLTYPVSSNSAYANPIISLPYITLQGAYSSTYNLTYFRKIPFAAPPTGPKNRFRAPQPPLPVTNGTYDTDQDFDMCAQRTVNGSEDCLYLGLYSRPWDMSSTQNETKRPVLVAFYGGAFIQGSASFTMPPPAFPILNVSASNDFVVVYPNYRVNAFGFLPGKRVLEHENADPNMGLLDQQAALEWVRKHIGAFGGDAENVTIWGQSAGAGSVVAQVIANGGETSPRLFKKALASSAFWPKTYRVDAPESEEIYDQMVELTGCGNQTDTLGCLKRVDVQTIRDASLVVDADNTYTTSSYTWAPVVDGVFLKEKLTEAALTGKVNAEMIWGMYNTHEGENFVPSGLNKSTTSKGFNSSEESFDKWLRGFLPKFGDEMIEGVKELYPKNGSSEMIDSYDNSYVRAGLIYRDLVLACPGYWIAKAGNKGYVGEYSISPARHGSDTIYWNRINAVQQTNPLIYKGYAGAFASFFETGDPNAHKLTNSSEAGVPEIDSGKEFVITADGFKQVEMSMLKERCAFWEEWRDWIPV